MNTLLVTTYESQRLWKALPLSFAIALYTLPASAANTHYDINFHSTNSQSAAINSVIAGSFDYDATSHSFSNFSMTWTFAGHARTLEWMLWDQQCHSAPCVMPEPQMMAPLYGEATWNATNAANSLGASDLFLFLSHSLPISEPQDYFWSTQTNVVTHQVPYMNFSNTGPVGSFFAVFTNLSISSPVAIYPEYLPAPPIFNDSGTFDISAAPVPEPETYAMMLAGLGLLGAVTRRRKQKLIA